MPRATGGLGDLKEVDERIKEVVAKVESDIRSQLVDKLGEVSGPILPVGYKTQVVAGTNFFVKLLVGEGEPKIVHARIYRNLQGEVSLHSVTEEKAHEDDVEYF
jgi:cystatin-A/B